MLEQILTEAVSSYRRIRFSLARRRLYRQPVFLGVCLSAVIGLTACRSGAEKSRLQPDARQTNPATQILSLSLRTPETCKPCHPQHYEEWRASMHAYSFQDPVFFALNDIAQNRSNMDQFCVKCHSPFATLLRETPPGFARSQLSPLAQHGMSCEVCHASADPTSGQGITVFRLDGVKNGPIENPQPNEFHRSEFSTLFTESGQCQSCHNVFLPSGFLVEKTSREWDDSFYDYHDLNDNRPLATCQTCHMPSYQGQAAVDGPQREVHRHTFAGVDIPLIDFPGKAQTIEQVRTLLQNAVTMTVTAPQQIHASDSLAIAVTIANDKTGHNVPSGTIFHREMWIELMLRDTVSQRVLYASGLLDQNQDLRNHNSVLVKNGNLAADQDLALFNGSTFKNGEATHLFWEATAVENHSLPPFKSRTATYAIAGPFTGNALELSLRLRFRSFPPYLLREIGQAVLIDKLIVFDMAATKQPIAVLP